MESRLHRIEGSVRPSENGIRRSNVSLWRDSQRFQALYSPWTFHGAGGSGQVCDAVIALYEAYYPRAPTGEDVARLVEENTKRGFPGMVGSLDCTHVDWDNCPVAWQAQYTGKE